MYVNHKLLVLFLRSQKLEAERLVNEVEKQKAREDALKEKESILKQKFKTEVEK